MEYRPLLSGPLAATPTSLFRPKLLVIFIPSRLHNESLLTRVGRERPLLLPSPASNFKTPHFPIALAVSQQRPTQREEGLYLYYFCVRVHFLSVPFPWQHKTYLLNSQGSLIQKAEGVIGKGREST